MLTAFVKLPEAMLVVDKGHCRSFPCFMQSLIADDRSFIRPGETALLRRDDQREGRGQGHVPIVVIGVIGIAGFFFHSANDDKAAAYGSSCQLKNTFVFVYDS